MSKTIPILFKPYMSRALLDGAKTETRRLNDLYGKGDTLWVKETWTTFSRFDKLKPSELFVPGKRGVDFFYIAGGSMHLHPDGSRVYRNDSCNSPRQWPSIFLPQVGSRQTIIIEERWTEPLLDITEDGAIAEGIQQIGGEDGFYFGVEGLPQIHAADPRKAYFQLWDLINGAGAAQSNPTVWAHRFTHHPVNFEDLK